MWRAGNLSPEAKAGRLARRLMVMCALYNPLAADQLPNKLRKFEAERVILFCCSRFFARIHPIRKTRVGAAPERPVIFEDLLPPQETGLTERAEENF
jgi:hypothetical protein